MRASRAPSLPRRSNLPSYSQALFFQPNEFDLRFLLQKDSLAHGPPLGGRVCKRRQPMQRDSFMPRETRLPSELIARLEPKLRDALDHSLRREIVRILNQRGVSRSFAEIEVELRACGLSRLGYHLQVLRRTGAVATEQAGVSACRGQARYASAVFDDGQVRAVLRATERGDREMREAMAVASVSPLLTMFRVPRPVRTIRLRSRGQIDMEREL